MPFEVQLHPNEAIIEIVYPAHPTPVEIADYVTRLRRIIDAQTGTWTALVDQRQLKTMTPELLSALKVMNGYAQSKGMARVARVVPDALGSLSAWRVGREASLRVPMQTFESREEAVSWLRSPLTH